METAKRLLLITALLLGVAAPARLSMAAEPSAEGPAATIVTEDGQVLLTTGLVPRPGDRFIAPDNELWWIFAVKGARATARRIGRLSQEPTLLERQKVQAQVLLADLGGVQRPADVIIYHTHSDESYIPGDGTESSRDKGGVYSVGAAFAAGLTKHGLSVLQRPDNHNPHDHGSYMRSRRTVLDSLGQSSPAALFDIHRDAAPASEYRFTGGGRALSRVMIVIGRSNPAHETNLAFARLIKAKADELHPGLVRGIYLGQGNYNQDVSARNILLEAGSQEVPRAEAEAGLTLMADAVAAVLKDVARPGTSSSRVEARAARRGSVWVFLITIVGSAGGFVLVNGGWRPALEKLRNIRRGGSGAGGDGGAGHLP